MVIVGTGHRPDKLGGYGQVTETKVYNLAAKVLESYKPERVITGMALGWDLGLAEAAFILGIPFDAYLPFDGQEGKWPTSSQIFYRNLLKYADNIVMCSAGDYDPKMMFKRNHDMVDVLDSEAGIVAALWNGDMRGGTAECVKYANAQRAQIVNFWPEWLKGLQ